MTDSKSRFTLDEPWGGVGCVDGFAVSAHLVTREDEPVVALAASRPQSFHKITYGAATADPQDLFDAADALRLAGETLARAKALEEPARPTTLTAHQLARQLLLLEDKPIIAYSNATEWYENIAFVDTQQADEEEGNAYVLQLKNNYDPRQW